MRYKIYTTFETSKNMKNILIFVLIILLTSCTPTQTEALPATEAVIQTAVPEFTPTLAPTVTATNTPAPSSTATPGYHAMSDEEKLAQSQAFVERANTYDGLVEVFPAEIIKGLNVVGSPEDYPSYWCPTCQGEYKLGNGSWRSAHNTPDNELDKTGESFPNQTFPGYENEDGTLVMIDPETGVETTFGKVFIPGFGEITMGELYAMDNQDELGMTLTESLLTDSNISPDDKWDEWTQESPSTSVFLPGFIYEQNHFYASLSGAGSGGPTELPEEGWIYREMPTNSFIIPIFNPETGEFMFWLNVQQGNMVKTLAIEYSESGTSYFDSVSNANPASFGYGGADEFGVLIEDRRADISHSRGGARYLLQGNEGVGDINDIERILNASTEQEVLDIIAEFRIFVSSPFQIAFPER